MNAAIGRRFTERMKWAPADDAQLAALWQTCSLNACAVAMGRSTGSIYNRVHKLGLKRTEEYKAITGSGQFGSRPPWNKGLVGYQAGGKSTATQFKQGDKPSNTWQPIGAERTSKDGILYRKVADTGAKSADWKAVHVMVWEERNGALPDGHLVVFRDRNRDNLNPDNLIAVTRAENMRRNSIDRYPPEYRSTAIALGWFNRKLRNMENENTD